MASEEGETCIICQDDLLSKDVCALSCGHVYHSECVTHWLQQSLSQKPPRPGICPSCKTLKSLEDIRPLNFEVCDAEVILDEGLRLEEASLEECEQRFDELSVELAENRKQLEQFEQENALAQDDACKKKEKRSRIKENLPELAEQEENLRELVCELSTSNATTQVTLDTDNSRSYRKLPFPHPREADPDLREERRKLKTGYATDRARQMHSSFLAAYQQDVEIHRTKYDREAAAREVEEQLKGLRREDIKIRRQFEERRRSSESVVASSSSKASLERSLTVDSLDEPVERTMGNSNESVASISSKQTSFQRSLTIESLEAREEEDADMLYGPAVKIARKGVLGRKVLPVDDAMPDSNGKPSAPSVSIGKIAQPTRASLLQRQDSKARQLSQELETSSQVSSTPSSHSKASSLTIGKLEVPVEMVSLAPEVVAQDEEDDEMLYGGPSSKTVRKQTSSRAALKSELTSKGGLFAGRCGSGARPTVATPATAVPIPRRTSALQDLFARRRV